MKERKSERKKKCKKKNKIKNSYSKKVKEKRCCGGCVDVVVTVVMVGTFNVLYCIVLNDFECNLLSSGMMIVVPVVVVVVEVV